MIRNLLILLTGVAAAAVLFWVWRRRRAATPAAAPPLRDDGGRANDTLSLPAASSEPVLDHDAAMRGLYALALGWPADADVAPAQRKVMTATARALKAADADRYLPRQPMLLPRLLRAVSAEDASRGEIAGIISGDPALVSNLLRLANSPLYRTPGQSVESVDRAVALLGLDGVRSLLTVALVQPLFRSADSPFGEFVGVTWEHASRAGAAAETRAATLGAADPVAAQLLALVTGLGAIVVFRVALERYRSQPDLAPDAAAIAGLLETQIASAARRIAKSWELPGGFVDALDDADSGRPASAADSLRRSIRFGRHTAALALLVKSGKLGEAAALASLPSTGASRARIEGLWAHLIQ